MDLSKLAEPFSHEDIEFRVSRSGKNSNGIFCIVLAYITARAIQKRLDDVCGPENWRNEEPRVLDLGGKPAFACGISIRINNEWVAKWDVCEPTNVPNIDPAKGGFSGAMKRAGAEWGVGRYLYHLDETFAETTPKLTEAQKTSRKWNYATLPKKSGGDAYFWKAPGLPAWALPKDPEHEVSKEELTQLKQNWQAKFGQDLTSPRDIHEGFVRFVHSVVGESFPVSDLACWTKDALRRVSRRIESTTDPNGPSSDVPFDGAGE